MTSDTSLTTRPNRLILALVIGFLFVLCFARPALPQDIVRLVPTIDSDQSDALRAIRFSYDSQESRYRYRLLPNQIKGVALLDSESGISIVADKIENGSYQLKYVSFTKTGVNEVFIEGIVVTNLATAHVREGDKGTVHIAWLEADKKTLSYAHVDDSAQITQRLSFSYEEAIKMPPSFYMLPHVLVGRHQVGLLRASEKEGNPVAVLDIFEVGYDKIGRQETVTGAFSATNESCSGNDYKGSFTGVLNSTGICERRREALESSTGEKNQGLFRIVDGIEVGSPIQPQGDHAWYGNTYLSLSYHIAPNGLDLEFRRIAILLGGDAVNPDSRKIGSDISLLSNLTGPINSYQGEIGRGGIAWLEGRPGNEILVNVFREGILDTAQPLNSEVAGAISFGSATKKALYWIDQGEMIPPILFVRSGMGYLYQVDLQVPDAFTAMPLDESVSDVLIWPAMEQFDSSSVVFVLAIDDRGRTHSVHHLSRRWKGADLIYDWDQLVE